VVAFESLTHFNRGAQVALGEDEVLHDVVRLLQHLLVVGFALNCISCADFNSHRRKNSIMVPQQTATHNKIVFPYKFDVFCLFVTLPVPTT
jgi:hypothetical protein